mgnify:CR=1 FL=1
MTSIETDVREINESKRALTEKIGRVTGSVKIPPSIGEFRYPLSQGFFTRRRRNGVTVPGAAAPPVIGVRGKRPPSLLLSLFVHALFMDTSQLSSMKNSGSKSQVSHTALGVCTTMSNIIASPLSGVSGISTSFWMM